MELQEEKITVSSAYINIMKLKIVGKMEGH